MFLLSLIVGGGSVWAQSWTGNEVQNGTFFLYNVGADKFLNNGDPAQGWGTNAYLQAGFGMDVTLAQVSEGVYSIETRIKNNDTQHYLNSNTWCDGGVTNWEFRAVAGETNTYQIISNGQYLMATEALNDVEMQGDPGSRVTSTYWKLVTLDDFKTAMRAKTYSAENPMDVSVFIQGRSFARNDQRNNTWVTTHNGGNWTFVGWTKQNKYYGNEAYNNTFDVHQSITGLPEGTYEVQCSGFGTNGTTYIYGNTTSKAIQSDNTTGRGTNMEAKWIAIHEDNAFAGQTTGTFAVGDGNLTVGIKREAVKSGDWCVYDEFRLYFYGLDLSGFEATLASAVEAAEAIEESSIPTAAWNALNEVITANNKSWTSVAEYTDATNAIIAATNTAKALQTNYARYQNVKTAVLAINNSIDISSAETQMAAATTNEGIDTAILSLRNALTSYLANAGITNDNIDLTAALIDNASPGTAANTNYWTCDGTVAFANNLCEYWSQAGVSIKQTIAPELPVGYYNLTAVAYTRDNMTAVLNAGTHTMNIVGVASSTVNTLGDGNTWIGSGNGVNVLTFQLTEATSNLEIGLTADSDNGDHWMVWRSFKLEYLGTAPLVLFQNQLADAVTAANAHATELTGNIPSAALSAYSEAITTAAAQNSSIDECLQSVADIETATANADALVVPYAAFQAIVPNATFAGVATATINDQSSAVAEATTAEAIQTAVEALQTAIDALAIDVTNFTITNPTAQDKTGWEGTDFGSHSDGVCEYWNKSGADFHQTITDLPAGDYRLTVTALQRKGMAGTVYAGEERTIIAQVGNPPVNNLAQAAAWFNEGNGKNYVYFTVAETSDVVIGLTADDITSDYWTVWKSFKLETFTETAAASYMRPGYETALNAAKAYQDVDMFAEDKTALNTAISENTVEEASATIAIYETAIANLNAATAAAEAAVYQYTNYNAIVEAINEKTNVDLTSFVVNADFETGNLTGWTSVDGGAIAGNTNFNSTKFVERWKNGIALETGSLTHDAITLPAGAYAITADAQNIEQYNSNAGGTGLFLCANNEQTEIGAKGKYRVFVTVADKEQLTIKFLLNNCTGNWVAYDNVKLFYIGADATWAENSDFTALTEATQPTAKLGFDEGDYAPYNNSDNIAAVQAELDKVQADMNNYGKALKATVTAAIEAINALEWVANVGEVNAVYDGTFANAENDGAPAGWTMSNNTLGGSYRSRAFVGNDKLSEFNETNSALFIRFDNTNSNQGSMYYYGNTAGYTMPLKAATRYYVKADVKGWGSTGKPQRMNVTGPAGFSAVGETLTLANNGDTDDAAPQQFFIVFTTAEAGNYTINFQSPGEGSEHNAVVSNIELKKVPQIVLNDETGCTEAVTYADVTVNRTVKGGNKWNSFTVPFDMAIPEGWTVKELAGTAENGEYLTLQFTKTDAIEAGKPYMVKLAENAEDLTEISVAGVAINPTLNNIEVTGATMIGNFEPTTVPTGAFFISNNRWFEAAKNNPVNIKAFRAYIELSQEATARGIKGIFSDLEGEVTGINSVNATEKKFDGTVYDLSGRKVAQPARGLYIVNGKKVVIK